MYDIRPKALYPVDNYFQFTTRQVGVWFLAQGGVSGIEWAKGRAADILRLRNDKVATLPWNTCIRCTRTAEYIDACSVDACSYDDGRGDMYTA